MKVNPSVFLTIFIITFKCLLGFYDELSDVIYYKTVPFEGVNLNKCIFLVAYL